MTFNALKSLASAKRPVIIIGAGVRLAGAMDLARQLSIRIPAPIAPTWAALDMFPDDMWTTGSFGTHGTRYGNFAVQNADWILAIGTRLDTKATGTPVETFARDAKIFMVDIDQHEIDKFGSRVEGLCCDAKEFLTEAVKWRPVGGFHGWHERIQAWKNRYPVPSDGAYRIVKSVCENSREGDIIVTETGCTVAWVAQTWRWKRNQRFLHAWNQTPMGWGLAAAIGAHYASGKPITLLTGDGSLMMSIGELATIAHRKLPIKIVLLNNGGHAMCRQTQREWLGSQYSATSVGGGLSFPNFVEATEGFKIAAFNIDINPPYHIGKLFADDLPRFLEATIDPEQDVVPKVKFGYPNEDGHPLLPWDEFSRQMVTPPIPRPE
jgi:acetolactate synthase I/II/III large subunit